MWHGALEGEELRSAFLATVANRSASGVSFDAARDRRMELLADLVEENLDVDALLDLAREGAPALPALEPGASR